MGREIRRVPADWEHPKQDNGKWQPQREEYYGDALAEWIQDNSAWDAGTHPDLLKGTTTKDEYPFYAMWAGNPPDVNYYRTRIFKEEELTHIQLYESTSEGTPKSPVFHRDDFEKLCEYAAEHVSTFATFKATKEEWMAMLSDGFVHHQEGNVTFC